MEGKPSQTAERVIAILIMAWGAGWMARYAAAGPDDWLVLTVAAGLGLTAIAVGISVWRSSPSAVAAYIAWAAADVLGLVTLDVLVEPAVWKVALGGAMTAAVLTVIGSALVSARRPRALAA